MGLGPFKAKVWKKIGFFHLNNENLNQIMKFYNSCQKKEGFLLLFQQLEDEDQFLCGESQCWSWSRKNPSSPAPAGSLQLQAPLTSLRQLGALGQGQVR